MPTSHDMTMHATLVGNALYSVPDQVTTTGHVKSHVQDQDTNFNMYETPGLLTKEASNSRHF